MNRGRSRLRRWAKRWFSDEPANSMFSTVCFTENDMFVGLVGTASSRKSRVNSGYVTSL